MVVSKVVCVFMYLCACVFVCIGLNGLIGGLGATIKTYLWETSHTTHMLLLVARASTVHLHPVRNKEPLGQK